MRVLVVLVGVIAFTTVCDAWTFDCRRELLGLCQNGGTCSNTYGTCTCADPAVNSGYDCSVVVADEVHADCTAAPCLNGGTCHKPAAAAPADPVTCLCTPEYTGATCDTNRIELTCDSYRDTMTVEIRPIVGTFGGVAFVKDQQTDPSCILEGAGTDADPLLFNGYVNTACGGTTNTIVNGVTQKSRVLIVAFMADLLTPRDIMITLTCGTDSVLSITTAIEVTSVFANLQEEERVEEEPGDADVDFTLFGNGAAITGAIDLGTEVTITASLTADGLARFQQLRVIACAIGSHVDDTDVAYVERDLVNGFCVSPDLEMLLTQPLIRFGTTVSIAFSAFKYAVSDNLVVTCVIEVCANGVDCNADVCNGDVMGFETGFGRKKREAGTIDKILQRNIGINDPLLANTNSLKEFKETKACYQSWEMTATVVALSVALLICLLICIILVIKAILNRRQRREDMREAASTTHLHHLPTIVSNKA